MKAIKNYQGLYEISEDGKVFSIERKVKLKSSKGKEFFIHLKRRELKQIKSSNGYVNLMLSKDNKQEVYNVHRLVAETFIPNPENKPEVNHENGIKTDNNVTNLIWVTVSENVKHAYKIGLISQEGDKNNGSKLIKRQVLKIRRLYATGRYLQKVLAKRFDVSIENISAIASRRSWKNI